MDTQQQALLGILGGMGPLATVDFMDKLTRLTPAKCDQEHLPWVTFSQPGVPDSNAAIQSGGHAPMPYLTRGAAWLAAMQAGSCAVLDCPISGTAVRMKERAWTVFCSGDRSAYERVKAMLQVFTDNVPHVGAFGNGMKMKFAANHLVAIYNMACAESVNLARKMGLDPQDVLDLFGSSPVIGTGVMRLRVPLMIRREYTPPTMKVEVWQKDMQVIGDMAREVDCATPLFNACGPIYSAAMAQGLGQ
jgi:3-hydroxyisobutyrate dehydrogenase-like beta-hydroxyacid dehydrogenase